MSEKLWTTEDVAKYFGKTINWVDRKVARGALPCRRGGNGPRVFYPDEVKKAARRPNKTGHVLCKSSLSPQIAPDKIPKPGHSTEELLAKLREVPAGTFVDPDFTFDVPDAPCAKHAHTHSELLDGADLPVCAECASLRLRYMRRRLSHTGCYGNWACQRCSAAINILNTGQKARRFRKRGAA